MHVCVCTTAQITSKKMISLRSREPRAIIKSFVNFEIIYKIQIEISSPPIKHSQLENYTVETHHARELIAAPGLCISSRKRSISIRCRKTFISTYKLVIGPLAQQLYTPPTLFSCATKLLQFWQQPPPPPIKHIP